MASASLVKPTHKAVKSHHAALATCSRMRRTKAALIKAGTSRGPCREGQQTANNFPRGLTRTILRAAGEAEFLATRGWAKNGLLTPDKPTISYNDLRRSAITNWSKAANIQTVSRLAGHSDISTTQRYDLAAMQDQIELARWASEAAMLDASVKTDDAVMKSTVKSLGETRTAEQEYLKLK